MVKQSKHNNLRDRKSVILPDKLPPIDLLNKRADKANVIARDTILNDRVAAFRSEFEVYVTQLSALKFSKLVKDFYSAYDSVQKYISLHMKIVKLLPDLKNKTKLKNIRSNGITEAVFIVDDYKAGLAVERGQQIILEVQNYEDLDLTTGLKFKKNESMHSYLKNLMHQLENAISSTIKPSLDKLHNSIEVISLGLKKGFIAIKEEDQLNFKTLVQSFSKFNNSVSLESLVTLFIDDKFQKTLDSFEFSYPDLSKHVVNPDNFGFEDLPKVKRSIALRQAELAGEEAELEYRSSNEARTLKLVAEISSTNPDHTQITKLVSQLQVFGAERTCQLLDELTPSLSIDKEVIDKVAQSFNNASVEIESEVIAEPEITSELPQHTGVEVEEGQILSVAEEKVYKSILLEELGVLSSETRDLLIASCNISYLERTKELLRGFDHNLFKKIMKLNPLLLDPENQPGISNYLTELNETLTLCSSISTYEAFNPYINPEHFCSLDVLSRTAKAAKLLKQALNDIYSNDRSLSAESQISIYKNQLEKLIDNSYSMSGSLCVAIVFDGFIINGYLTTGSRVISMNSIRDNLKALHITAYTEEIVEVLGILAEEKVVIPRSKRHHAKSFTLQNDPTKVSEGVLKDLLIYTLKIKGD